MNYGNFGEESNDNYMNDEGLNQNINLENDDRGYGHNQNKSESSKKAYNSDNPSDKEMTYQTKDATITEKVSGAAVSYITKIFSFLTPYFDVELTDVVQRLKGALIPFTKSFYKSAENKPDIYGPFWVFTTIVFLITVCGNFSCYLSAKDNEKFEYNFRFLPYAALFIFGIGFGVPLIIFLVGRFVFKIDYGYVLNLCLYGYSFVILIPILFLCMIPSNLAEFILLIYYTIHSSAFLLFNMWNLISEKAPKAKYVMLGILGGFQLILFFALKFYFFKNANVQIKE